MEGGQGDLKKKEEEALRTRKELGEMENPFEEMEGLTSEVQEGKDEKFVDMTRIRRRQEEDEEDEQWRKAA